MSVHENIGFLRFPKQGDWVGQRVRVLFDYDTTLQIEGTIVREDREEPGRMIIHLDDGRFVLASVLALWLFLYYVQRTPLARRAICVAVPPRRER